MSGMKAVQVPKAGGDFELVEREIPEPKAGEVRVRVEACGICRSDEFVKEGYWPGIDYPRVPGHEVAGRVDEVGEGVEMWQVGNRVGVGWHGGHCFTCDRCLAGDFVNCRNALVTGITHDGGYAEYLIAPQHALARIPDDLGAVEAAPLLCAGITTYNALRNSGARPGDLVAIQGIGGLGHLAIQFASKMGFKTVAVSRGKDKENSARGLGAHIYLDADAVDVGEELAKLGGASIILTTSPDSGSMSPLIDGMAANGTLLIVGAGSDPLEVAPLQLIPGRRSIQGWAAGHGKDAEDTMNFSVLVGARPVVEEFPLESAREAYERAMSNDARFRVVLKIG